MTKMTGMPKMMGTAKTMGTARLTAAMIMGAALLAAAPAWAKPVRLPDPQAVRTATPACVEAMCGRSMIGRALARRLAADTANQGDLSAAAVEGRGRRQLDALIASLN